MVCRPRHRSSWVLLAFSELSLRGLQMKSIRREVSFKPRAWIYRAVLQGTVLAGCVGICALGVSDVQAQESNAPVSIKDWRSSGPWRAIGISPRKMVLISPERSELVQPSLEGSQESSMVRKASGEHIAKLSEASVSSKSGSDLAGVVNAVATNQSRQPSLVKVPSLKIDAVKPVEVRHQLEEPVPQALELETSRSIGAKVRLSLSTVSDGSDVGLADVSSSTNSSNLKVTRSGDITAETPVKINFNQDRILALPAFPSPDSPYSESGIEIPVRVEAVSEMVQSIHETRTPLAQDMLTTVDPEPEELRTKPVEAPALRGAVADISHDRSESSTETKAEASGVALSLAEVAHETTAPRLSQEVASEHSESEASEQKSQATLATDTAPSQESVKPTEARPSSAALRFDGPVSAAPAIVPLPSIEATSEEIKAITGLARSTRSSGEAVLSQPGAPVLITTGPMTNAMEVKPEETIQLESQDIRALQVTGGISRLHIVDSSVCQAVCNGSRLFLVGDQAGETLVEVNMGKLHKPMYIKVVVQKPWTRSASASVSLEQMQAIVSRLAPTADVTVQPNEEGNLVVKGFADNNQQAKKVLEAIRKMVLVPVIDQLEIR